METDWREIPGYPGYYAHPDGLVMGLKGRILKGTNHMSYQRIYLKTYGTKQFIHRLVALTFLPNPDQKPAVDHIDRDKSNNAVSNLRWATHLENGNNKPESKCIFWSSKNKGWQAQKTIFGKTICSKYFKTAAEAEEWLKIALNP